MFLVCELTSGMWDMLIYGTNLGTKKEAQSCTSGPSVLK